MSTPPFFPLLALPAEIRVRIYKVHFSASIVHVRSSLVLSPSPSPPLGISHALSLLLVCKQLHAESAPLLHPHILFWIESWPALTTLVRTHTPDQLRAIRHFAIWTSLMPLPIKGVRDLAVEELSREQQQQRPLLEVLCQAFYRQICVGLRTLVLVNKTDPAARRRIVEQDAGRVLGNAELDSHCYDGMRLKVHVLLPILKEVGIVTGQKRLRKRGDDVIPFEIVLRFSGMDGMHRMGVYRSKKEEQEPPISLDIDDSGL